ncbi:MAG: DUF2961 domain-containing protein [Phycisphaeraceae bacterium]|nr:DUF2961 domain-containing protein [Phycisphaeraceae bacterium]
MQRNMGWLLLVLLQGVVFISVQAQTIRLESLLDEMIDRDAVARWPQPAYTCSQASSYDRRSVSPDDQSTWYANGDRSWFVRSEQRDGRQELVMMDVEGPGAIVRIWCTWSNFSDGTVRIYLDGSEQPAIEGPLAAILDGGALVDKPLGQGDSELTEYGRRGHNLYLPIPYAKHCMVTYQSNGQIADGAPKGTEALYYQINYRTYAQETAVETFSMEQLSALNAKIDSVQKALSAAQPQTGDLKRTSLDGALAPGESKQVQIIGPAAIRALTLKLAAQDMAQALRSTVLEINCDGEQTVWCPLGDFFGVGYRPEAYWSWYTRSSEDGQLSAWWVMPFEKSCSVSLHNLGKQPVTISDSSAGTGDWTWDDRSMHLHAAWHLAPDLPTQTNEPADHGAFDFNYVTVEGKGVYVGDTLTIYNGHTRWWGEGDEKVYVDGETFPSHIGTGTEDYYGYAWCRPEKFSSPFHAQPYGQGNNHVDMSVNSRYRLLDGIPFTASLKFDMEVWHWAKTIIDYAPTTFWYARPGATSNVQPNADMAALPVKLAAPPMQVEGAIEGEDMKVKGYTGGNTRVQEGGNWGWSGDKQLWWRDGHVGDELMLTIDVPRAGRYHAVANLTKAKDYAIVTIKLGDLTTPEINLYHTEGASQLVELGDCTLKAGSQTLLVRITGMDPAAVPARMFGLDYLKLTPLD